MRKTLARALPDVTFVGPVAAVNGLGVSARGYLDGLIACGAAVDVECWTAGFEATAMQPMLYPPSRPGAVTIVHLNMDLILGENLLNKPPLLEFCARSRRKILIPYWELAALKPEWLPILNQFDEVWCASRFIQRAIRAVWAKPVRLIRPFLFKSESEAELPPEQPFSFLYLADLGSVMRRKNPDIFWRSYAENFSKNDGVRCVMKLHYAKPEDPRVIELLNQARGRPDMSLILETLSKEALIKLQTSCGCYVSPHRSEGLGLTVIEAMRFGKPVIATPYGGVVDFISSETAFPLPYRLTEVGPGSEPYPTTSVWADPDVQALKCLMRRVAGDRSAAATRGAAGRRRVLDLFGASCVADMRDALEQIQDALGSARP